MKIQSNSAPATTRAPWDIQPKRITKADIKIPKDSGQTVEQLQTAMDRGRLGAEGPARRTVARDALHVAETVFQWRGDQHRDQWTRTNHIHTLAKAVRDGDLLDPLLVLPVGDRFYVIDGHHRLAAYDTAEWTKGIPVEVFGGNLTEARVRALSSNVKDKLPMTAQAKSEAAWRITKENLGDLKAKQVVELTGVSMRQVRSMRQVWRELNDRDGIDRDTLPQLTWKNARDLWEGIPVDRDFDQETWKEQKAQQVVDLINRHNVTLGLLQDIEVTALALRMLDEKLPEALIEQWAGDHPELISDLAARIANPPGDIEF